METNRELIKVSSYAKFKDVSPTWIYKQAKKDLIELVIIDGVKFIRLTPEETEEYVKSTGN